MMNQQKPPKAIFYYQNATLVPETNLAFDILKLLYHSLFGRATRIFLRRRLSARILGMYHNTAFSRKLVQPFIKAYGITMNDFEIPTSGYATFNDFFIRRLKPHARPLPANQNSIISPADGKLFVIPQITQDTHFFAKKLNFCLQTFFGSKDIASSFNNGTLCMFRLAPYDYHRFHAPISGTIKKIYHIHGVLESVNPISFSAGHQPLTTNERIVILMHSPTYGDVAVVAVGALFVGSITITQDQGSILKIGDELGYFAFGGSTIAVIFGPNQLQLKASFITHSLQGYETAINMGEILTD